MYFPTIRNPSSNSLTSKRSSMLHTSLLDLTKNRQAIVRRHRHHDRAVLEREVSILHHLVKLGLGNDVRVPLLSVDAVNPEAVDHWEEVSDLNISRSDGELLEAHGQQGGPS